MPAVKPLFYKPRQLPADSPMLEQTGKAGFISPPFPPSDKQQAAFDALDNFAQAEMLGSILYGGAVGGGKSEFCLMLAAKYSQLYPQAKMLMVRKTYAELSRSGGLQNRALEYWKNQPGAKWNQQEHRLTAPNGAALEFAHLSEKAAHLSLSGAEFQVIIVDEASQILPEQLEFLKSRIRRNVTNPAPLAYVLCSNPPGVAHDWLKEKYLKNPEPGNLYIPSLVSENPGLRGDEYEAILQSLPPMQREQLLHGNWDATPTSGYFRIDRIVQTDTAPENITWVRAWDLAASAPGETNPDPDYTAGARCTFHNGRFYVRDIEAFREEPGDTIERIARVAQMDGPMTPIIIEQEQGASGKLLVDGLKKELPQHNIVGYRMTGNKTTRAMPLSAAMHNGIVYFLPGEWQTITNEQLASFPNWGHDDIIDALAMAFHYARAGEFFTMGF